MVTGRVPSIPLGCANHNRSIFIQNLTNARRIRANCLKPALVRTPIYDNARQLLSFGATQDHEARYPLGIGEPEDIASAALFLASEDARFITGTEIVVDGGMSARCD